MSSREDLLIRIAELYYYQGLSQKEIADMVEISRPSISRLLDEAKETGVVEIIIHNTVRKNSDLSVELRSKLGLKDAIVVAGKFNYDDVYRICGKVAASFLGSILENNNTIGISWGPALKYLCDSMAAKEYYNVNVVQMVGCLGTGDPELDGLELAMRISEKVKGTYSNIYAPVFVDNELVYKYLVKQYQIETTLAKAMHTDIICTGIGAVEDSRTILQKAGYINDKVREGLLDMGAVGHLSARFYDQNGDEVMRDGWYTISTPLEAMRAAKWSVGIAASKVKARSTLAAVRAGYLNTLVVDEELAESVLQILADGPEAKAGQT